MLVATHDVEFAASFAERVLLLADGRLIADASAGEVLCGGWYFATETARILDGAGAGAAARARRGAIAGRIERASVAARVAGEQPPAAGCCDELAAGVAEPRRDRARGVLLVV